MISIILSVILNFCLSFHSGGLRTTCSSCYRNMQTHVTSFNSHPTDDFPANILFLSFRMRQDPLVNHCSCFIWLVVHANNNRSQLFFFYQHCLLRCYGMNDHFALKVRLFSFHHPTVEKIDISLSSGLSMLNSVNHFKHIITTLNV